MSLVRVFVDATVLMSRTQRDWLFHARVVTEGRMFSLQTSEDVLAETLAKLRDKNPHWDGGQITQVRKSVFEVFDNVLDDFPGGLAFPGADEGDTHVHAAAVHAGATMLLTSDSDFLDLRDSDDPRIAYEPIDPDSFFVLLDDAGQAHVREMTQRQINYYSARSKKPELVDKLRRAGCPGFAERVEERIAQNAGPRAVRLLQAARAANAL